MISRLNKREMTFVLTGIAVLFLVIIYLVIISPYRNALSRLDQQVEVRTRQLEDVKLLRVRYTELRKNVRQVERLLDSRRDFSSLTFIEALIKEVSGRESLTSMRPQPLVPRGQFAIEPVEIKLENVDLKQVLELLWAIEGAEMPMQVKNLYLKQRFDDTSRLDATMTITALRRPI